MATALDEAGRAMNGIRFVGDDPQVAARTTPGMKSMRGRQLGRGREDHDRDKAENAAGP